ncbi:MAG: aminotransferase class V-fold PLP-dependent enzyme [Pseudomonadota bacterium]
MPANPFDSFAESLAGVDVVEHLKAGLIGEDAVVEGPYGPKRMIYADYVASGRALRQIEAVVMEDFLPHYANSHTEASSNGATMTRLRRAARAIIAKACRATDDHAVIFSGNGATQGLNRLVHLFGLPQMVRCGARPLVILGPYEHHSNILPWRESGAEVVALPEAEDGGPDRSALDTVLARAGGRPVIGAFSAASNVTGILSDVAGLTAQLKAAGAHVVWDYAGGGPYLPINMCPGADAAIDAVVISPHKFVGGPQASGVLIVRKDAVAATQPTLSGGGTVRFVSPAAHDYATSLEAREEAGTPNVIGDLRAALCFQVKSAVGQAHITARNERNIALALTRWRECSNLELLGNLTCPRLPIFSFRVRDGRGGFVHQQLLTRLLSDRFGIQARGGCACAGPYVHGLLGIDANMSEKMRASILAGNEIEKPGFVRLNFGYLASDAEVETIIGAVDELSEHAADWAKDYTADPATAIFSPTSPQRLSA